MKKRFLVAAMAATLVSPLAAHAEATVYGKIHASADFNSSDTVADDAFEVNNRASRLGVKGSEDLGGGLKAVYKMEFGIEIDDSSKGNVTARNQYVGLSGAMGTVLMGRHDTPLKMAQGKFDEFNDTIGDMAAVIDGETRAENVVAYVSPKFGQIKFVAATIAGEGVDLGAANGGVQDGIADGYSLAFSYGDAKSLFVSVSNHGGDLVQDIMRVVATYNMGDFRVGGIYSVNDGGDISATAEDETSMGVSAAMKLDDKNTVKFQYLATADDGGTADNDQTVTSVGFDRAMSKATSVYAMYNAYAEDNNSVADVDTVSFGIVHKF